MILLSSSNSSCYHFYIATPKRGFRMFRRSLYTSAIASFCSISIAYAAVNTMEVKVQLKIGDKTNESVVIINSESYTQLSMDNEVLGFALKLVNTQDGPDFQVTPTYDKKQITQVTMGGKGNAIGAGLRVDGYYFDKNLAITILTARNIS